MLRGLDLIFGDSMNKVFEVLGIIWVIAVMIVSFVGFICGY